MSIIECTRHFWRGIKAARTLEHAAHLVEPLGRAESANELCCSRLSLLDELWADGRRDFGIGLRLAVHAETNVLVST